MHSEEVLVLGDFAENINSPFKTKSKIITGVRSTVCYIQLLFILKMIQVVFSTFPPILSQMTTCMTTCMMFCLWGSKDNDQLPSWITTTSKKVVYFSDRCGGQYKNYKNFMNLCPHKQDFGLDAEWIFFATRLDKSPCDGIGGPVKGHLN